jgi:tRNA A37 threonylcarbamoyltransferase TsaD
VTGKHTELVLSRGVGLHTVLGTTHDIAAGNALDQFAKLLQAELAKQDFKPS